jgi:mono/diheme cytochrome c family protein
VDSLRRLTRLAERLVALPAALAATIAVTATADPSPLPPRLSDTGLFEPGSTTTVGEGVLPFTPQYPLWSDGSDKRRWIFLPPGTAIDAADPDAWDFPVGTRLWKEFRDERAVETRYIERMDDGRWRYAAYVWDEDGREAVLAADRGAMLEAGPTGRYRVPSRTDCLACHEGPAVPVLGFSALQLSTDRDPLAPHADPDGPGYLNLVRLVATGRLVNLPPALIATAPRIAARTPVERAALGYLHGNCGHCHDSKGALDGLDLVLAQRVDPGADSVARVRQSLFGRESRYRPHGLPNPKRVALDALSPSTLTLRLKSTHLLARMPPLGVQVVDDEGVALVERWITEERHHHEEARP